MGVMAAFIFAAQMFNFQVAGGTSGHLLGGVLAAVLLGPWVATLVMTCVVAVQALVFSDGGLVVMGVNIFNMGIIGTLGGLRDLPRAVPACSAGRTGAASRPRRSPAWASVVLASIAMSLELAFSGTSPLELVLPAMVGVHVFIGIGEALITAAALGFIRRRGPTCSTCGPTGPAVGAGGRDMSEPARTAHERLTGPPPARRARSRRRRPATGQSSADGGGSSGSPSPRWSSIVLVPARVVRSRRARAGRGGRRVHRPGREHGLGAARRLRDPRHRRSRGCPRSCPASSGIAIVARAHVPPRARRSRAAERRGAAPWSSTATSRATARSTAPMRGSSSS